MLIYPTSLSILHMYIYICDVSILIYSFFYVVFVVYSARWIFIQDQLYLLVYNNRNIRPVAKELSVVFRLRKFKIFSDISDHLMLRTCYVDRTTNNTKYVYQNNIQFYLPVILLWQLVSSWRVVCGAPAFCFFTDLFIYFCNQKSNCENKNQILADNDYPMHFLTKQ